MKQTDIPLLEFLSGYPPLVEVSNALKQSGAVVVIDEVNWPEYPYKPLVQVFAGYTGDELVLTYRVEEQYIKAEYTHANDPVHEDSCVEFFISSGNGLYHNFECNCIGTVHAGYGAGREGRSLLSKREISKIRTYATLGRDPVAVKPMDDPWELTLAIPFSLFREREFRTVPGRFFRANFYKCGDALPVPHFLSWNRIDTAAPDFHRPGFFGMLKFVKD